MKTNVVRLKPTMLQHALLLQMAERASALWNVANYEHRQAFLQGQRLPTYAGQCASLKNHPVYRSLPSDVAQEVLKKLSEAWKSNRALREKFQKGELERKPGLVRYRKNKDGSWPTDWIPIKELSHRPKENRSSHQLRRLYFLRKARQIAAWEALAVRVVALLRTQKVGFVFLGHPKHILRETAYSKKWNGRIHAFWSFDQVLKVLEKHLAQAGIGSERVGERGSSSHCPWCQSEEVVRKPRYVLSCRSCKRKIHSDQAGSRNILRKENPGISWDALEARARPDTRRWNKHRWVDAENRPQWAPSADKALGILGL